MNNISDRIARKEYLPMSEEDQQEFIEAFGERETRKETDWKAQLVAWFVFGVICAIVTKFLGFENPLRLSPWFGEIIISKSLIENSMWGIT